MTLVPKEDLISHLELTPAHKDALELLDFVHHICVDNGIVYTLIGKALLFASLNIPFAASKPNISIAIFYPEYLKLIEILSQKITVNPIYRIVNNDNVDQFDFVGIWLLKKSKVELPRGRENDEIYYYNRISIVPVFYAGNTFSEWKKLRKTYLLAKNTIDSRAIRPEHSIFTKIKILKRIIKNKTNLKLRHTYSMKSILIELAIIKEPTKYAFCPAISEKTARKIKADEYKNVKTVLFSGVECYVFMNTDTLFKYSLTQKRIDRIYERPKSDLLLKGNESLRRVQLIQTEMLVEFDRICRKNKLRYNIAFGTLLGAVRHKGFIPWDDDVDVIMPYDDYCKLDQAMEADLDKERFFWRTHDTEKDFNLTYKHLKRNGTVYMKPMRERFNFHKGVLIDVFPVFNSANNKFMHAIHTRLSRFFRRATWAHMGADGIRKKKKKKFYYRQLAKPDNKKNYERFLRFATMFKENNGYYSYFGAGKRSPYHVYYLTPECFNDPIELEFEGHNFLAPPNYDEALSYCFGKDYMMYPTLKDRIPQHYAIIDLGNLFTFDEINKK
jgi:lipopolysaccharide cholinephosphotransferase